LNLRPWYQRRIVWTTPQQSYLINTIHEQKPVPSIYIRHSIDVATGRSIREVVDGQQRLAAVLEYTADRFAARHPNHPKPVKFTQLTSKERHQFLTTGLSVGYLLGADDSDVIEIFGRINSVSKKLSPPEKRNANFSGELATNEAFCTACRNHGSRLNEIRIVRNHIAHNNRDTRREFAGVVARRLGALPLRLPRAGAFVLREFTSGVPLLVEFVVALEVIVKDAAKL
jgi:hypothetical protein